MNKPELSARLATQFSFPRAAPYRLLSPTIQRLIDSPYQITRRLVRDAGWRRFAPRVNDNRQLRICGSRRPPTS